LVKVEWQRKDCFVAFLKFLLLGIDDELYLYDSTRMFQDQIQVLNEETTQSLQQIVNLEMLK